MHALKDDTEDDKKPTAPMNKRNLEIDIEENLDFEQANNAAQELLNDKVIEHDKKLA